MKFLTLTLSLLFATTALGWVPVYAENLITSEDKTLKADGVEISQVTSGTETQKITAQDITALERLANNGNTKAQIKIGLKYVQGDGVEQDIKKAFHYFLLAAENGDMGAQYVVATFYESDVGGKDIPQAITWYKKATKQGQPGAAERLGLLQAELKQNPGSDFSAVESPTFLIIKRSAKEGDALSQAALGAHYSDDTKPDYDLKKSLIWYLKAAEQGHSKAQLMLGLKYMIGEYGPVNNEKAYYWLKKAALKGNAPAQHYLGNLYIQGLVPAPSLKKAYQWHNKAAEQGYGASMLTLGVIYDTGSGTEQDLAKAFFWYEKGAQKGNSSAQLALGVMYMEGTAVKQDLRKAQKWIEKSVAQGNKKARKQFENLQRKIANNSSE